MGALMIMYYHMTEKRDAVNIVPSEEYAIAGTLYDENLTIS